MDKEAIRKRMRQRNRSLSAAERAACSVAIFREVERLEAFSEAHCVAGFCSLADEPDTQEALLRWQQSGKRIVVPRVEGEEMQFYDFQPDRLVGGSFGIAEPDAEAPRCARSEIDLMILPAVALTAAGARLGRGKGYYDRYLAHADFRAYTIGVGYPHQLLETLPTEPHDQLLKRVVIHSAE